MMIFILVLSQDIILAKMGKKRKKTDQMLLSWKQAQVQKVDNTIHQINHYPANDSVYTCFVNTSPLNSDLSSG